MIKQLLTGKDNKTYDIVRVSLLFGIMHLIALSAYDVIAHASHFNIQEFGLGFGAIIGAAGAALGLKKDTEPT